MGLLVPPGYLPYDVVAAAAAAAPGPAGSTEVAAGSRLIRGDPMARAWENGLG
jgi:hypothetical protein